MVKKKQSINKKTIEKKPHGRPPKKIDEQLLYKLAQTMLPVTSIAVILDCCVDTLDRRFSGVLRSGRENRRQSLVEAMWHKALVEADTKMMIWLSKQHLGYKEVSAVETSNTNFNIIIDEIPN